MVPTTDARTTKRRQRKSLLYMQRSCPELKDCSLWLRNLIAAHPARDLAIIALHEAAWARRPPGRAKQGCRQSEIAEHAQHRLAQGLLLGSARVA